MDKGLNLVLAERNDGAFNSCVQANIIFILFFCHDFQRQNKGVSLNLNVLSLPNIDMLKKISKDVYDQKW